MNGSGYSSRGMALMEVMVAGFLLVVGLMALLQIQLTALRQVQEAGIRQQASWLADDLVERIRVSPEEFARAGLSSPQAVTVSHCRLPATCDAEQFYLQELSSWQLEVRQLLPDPDVVLQTVPGSADETRMRLRMTWHSSSLSLANAFDLEFVL